MIYLTKIFKAVPVSGYMEENDVNSTCSWTRLEFKIGKDEKFLVQKLTRCKNFCFKIWGVVFFHLKSDTLYFSQIKIWRVLFQFKICFSSRLFRFSLNHYQGATNIKEQLVGQWRWLGVKKLFTSVWHVFVSCLLLSFWMLRSLWQLGSWWVRWLYSLHYLMTYKNLFGLQKMVTLQRFYFIWY